MVDFMDILLDQNRLRGHDVIHDSMEFAFLIGHDVIRVHALLPSSASVSSPQNFMTYLSSPKPFHQSSSHPASHQAENRNKRSHGVRPGLSRSEAHDTKSDVILVLSNKWKDDISLSEVD